MNPEVGAAPVRNRFLAFAFAGADLLVEASPDGVVGFAAGAFRARFGVDGDHFIAGPISALIAPADHATLAMALSTVALRGRLTPLMLRLNDAGQSRAAVAAMLMPGPPARLCVTIGPLPILPAGPAGEGPQGGVRCDDPRAFLREAEAALRGGAARVLGLVELRGWEAAQAGLPAGEGQALRAGIDEALERLPVGARASELATGRYGVLAAGEGELGALVERLEGLLRASPAGRRMRVSQTQVKVEAGGMRPGQAARALRYALARFAEAGADGAAASGMAGGLAGIVAEGQRRALEMRTSIAEHRFRLRFQPVVQLDDRRPHHYEALLRPDTGIEGLALGTQDYVLFAEAVGLSEELDLAVLDEALAALAGSPEVRVAVNVSGLSMQSAGFRGRLLARLDAAGPVARRLLVELTETAEVEDMEGAADSIARLRAAGVPVCIDDFGAGAAAFRYLRAFGVDFVKIDGSYVRAATGSARERGFIASMVDLAGAVGARIIAEMIETEEQAMLMSRMGVPFGQGWLFGRPGRLPGALR